MNRPRPLRPLALLPLLLVGLAFPNLLAAQAEHGPAGPSGFDALIGTWMATGDGFTSQLVYRWRLPGRIVDVSNELRGADQQLFGRYEGSYFVDPRTGAWRFFTAGGTRELHEGTAVWRDGGLWHDAVLIGGSIEGYSSVVLPEADTMRYHARYVPGPPDDGLLELDPLVYVRRGSPGGGGAPGTP